MKKEIREQIDYHINKIMELGKGECNVTVDVFFTDSSTKIITYIEESRDTPVKEREVEAAKEPKADPIVKDCDTCKYEELKREEEPCNDCYDEEYHDNWESKDKDCYNCKYEDLEFEEEPCCSCNWKDKWQPIEGIEPMKEEQPPYFFTTYVTEHNDLPFYEWLTKRSSHSMCRCNPSPSRSMLKGAELEEKCCRWGEKVQITLDPDFVKILDQLFMSKINNNPTKKR